jgi:hypothetical protein
MAEKPNPFLLPSQQIQFMEQGVHPMSPEAHPNVQSTFEQGTQAATARGDTDAYNARVDQYNRENPGGRQLFRKFGKHPQMRTAEFTSRGPITPPANTGGDPRAVSSYPHLNEYMMQGTSPEAQGLRGQSMGYDQSLQRQQDAERQNRLNAVRAGVGQEFPGMKAEDLMGMSIGDLQRMRALRQAGLSQDFIAPWEQGVRTTPDFTSRGPITPPANTGGDPRAVSSYPHLNRNMMRDTSPPMNTGGDPRAIQGAVRLPYDVTSAQDTVAARDSASEPKSSQGSAYYSPESGYRPGEMEPVDPILYEALPTPRTPAQLAESARVKAGSGQPLDAEERQWFSSSIRKQMQDAGKTEEEIQRALSRIDPATGMIPPRIR